MSFPRLDGSLLTKRLVVEAKISAIPSGRDAKAVAKGAAKGIGALETDGGGDGIDREVLGRQTPSSFIQPAGPVTKAPGD
jgi:hypothetical protein